MVEVLAARVAGKAPTSCEPVIFFFLNIKMAWVKLSFKKDSFHSLFLKTVLQKKQTKKGGKKKDR